MIRPRTIFRHPCSILTILLALLAGSAGVDAVARAAEGQAPFVAGLEDVPLMSGLTVAPQGGVTFDTPQGRIVEAVAHGTVSGAAVMNFYTKTLPQLGWDGAPGGVWRREGETLKIEIGRQGGRLEVRFLLTPG